MDNKNVINLALSSEQNEFITKALGGHNILVDACIGSGKTTAIQQLCNVFPSDRKILYLTYNRLLKLDAQAKIKNSKEGRTRRTDFWWGPEVILDAKYLFIRSCPVGPRDGR